jgi:hypothetical protein
MPMWLIVVGWVSAQEPIDPVVALALQRTTGIRWEIHDGRGRTIDAREWMGFTGDTAPLDRATRAAQLNAGWPVRIVGMASLAAAALPLVFLEPLTGVVPDSRAWSERGAELGTARAGAFVLATVGVAMISVSFVDQRPKRVRTQPLRRWLPAEQADVEIAAYNEALAQQFGR